MPTVTPESYYFSGDGLVWAARANSSGRPMGYRALGNVTSLVLSPTISGVPRKKFGRHHAFTYDEIPLSVGGRLTANLESIDPANIAMLAGDHAVTHQASTNTLALKGYTGAYTDLPHAFIGSITSIASGVNALTPYVDANTPYDYRLDENGGLIYINDGSVVDVDGLKAVASAVTAYSSVGGFLRLHTALGMTAREPGLLIDPGGSLGTKPIKFICRAAEVGYVDTDIPVSGPTLLTGTPSALDDGFALDVSYAYDAQTVVSGKATPMRHWSFLFQGLNSVNGELCNIRIPRSFLRSNFAFDLINRDGLASLPLEASLLFNPTDPDPQLFTIETLPQGFRPILG